MNEIEEYLLMIFLESINSISVNDKSVLTSGEFSLWEQFKQEELGRTIPEEFEVFVTDHTINELRNSNNNIMAWLCRKEWELVKQKIKITVVNE